MIFFDRPWKAIAVFAAAILSLGIQSKVFGAGGDLRWESGAAVGGKQEARAMAVDAAGDVVLAGYGEASGGEGRVVKMRGDGSGPAWSATFNLNGGYDVATAVAVDGSGDVVVAGYGNNGVNYDFHTAKYAGATGALLWQHSWKGAAGGDDLATAVTLDALDNIYVGGYSQGSGGRDDAVLIKYSPDGPSAAGSPLWVRIWNGSADGHDRILALAAGADGIAATGESHNATPDFDPLTLKYDFSGTLLWQQRHIDSGDGRGRAVAFDLSGNIFMTGYVSNGSNRDLYVAKYPAAGDTALWTTAPVDNGFDDEATALWVDGAGDVYVTGTTYSLTTHLDVFTLKFAGDSGAEQWRAQYNSVNGNSEYGQSLVVDEAGDLFVTGYLDDAGTGRDDFLTLKYAKNSGTQLWVETYDGAGYGDRAVGIGLQSDGTVLVGGWSDRWISGASDYDFYVLAYDPGAIDPPTGLKAQTVSNAELLLLWDDNSTGEDSFAIERRIGGIGIFSRIATVAADTTSFNDTGLTPDTRYLYRVKALSAASGDSHYSNEAEGRTTVIQEQAPAWLYTFDGGGDDLMEAIAVGPDNHPVVTGGSFSVAEASFDYHSLKVDRSTAAEIWSARYDDPDFENDFATAVAVDGTGRCIVTGYSSLYGGGAGNTNDIYTIGYPASGPPAAWADQYNGPSGGDDRSSAVSVSIDGSNHAVVIGYGKNADWNDDIYVIKYGADGSRLWAAVPYDGGGNDYPVALAVNGAGDIIVVGRSANGSNDDLLVAKYAGASGARLWLRTYAGPGVGNDYAEAVAVDADNIYVAGYASGSGSGDACLLKYDGAGNLLWQRLYDGPGAGFDIAKAVTVDPIDGEVLVAATTFVGAGNQDFVLLHYLPDGTLKWQKHIDRPSTDDGVAAMAMDRFGIATVTGSSGTDILAMKFDHDGMVIGANLVDGGYGEDSPVAVAVNALEEAYVAGFSTNAAGNSDYVVFRANGQMLAPPHPVNADAAIHHIDLTWTDNSSDETGFLLQRHVGACSDAVLAWSAGIDLSAGTTAYTDEGLTQGTAYCYRLRAYRNNGEFSREVLREATTAVPQAPGALTATAPHTTEVLLSWSDNTAGGESGYEFLIQRCQGTGCAFADTDPLFIVPAPATGWSDSSVCPGTDYGYRVMVKKEGVWASAFSAATAVVTPAVGAAPSGLTAQRVSETQIDLQWSDNTADESGFTIERCAGAGCSGFAPLATVAADQTGYDDADLAINTTYAYRVSAYRSADCGWQTPPGNSAEATTTLLAPEDLSAAATDTTRVNLNWTDRTATETGFRIERCEATDTIFCDQEGQFGLLATVAAGASAFSDSGICSGITYAYRVRAEKSTAPIWQSPWTATAQATAVLFQPPTELSATQISESEIRLSWSDANSDESGFYLERCDGDATACADGPFVQIATIAAGSTLTRNDSGLEPNAAYTYRVVAYKNTGCSWESAPSATAGAATAPLPPGNMAASPVDTTRIDLSWSDRTATETGYLLQRCAGSGSACDEDAEFADAFPLAAGATGTSDTSVCADSSYIYRVRAEKNTAPAWQTAWSVIAAATALPSAPVSLLLGNPTETSVSVRWEDASADESGFLLERCSGEAATCQDADFTLLRSYPASSGGNRLLYHLEETSGAVVDHSGSGNNGTAYNVTAAAAGYFDAGYAFNGTSSYIAAPVAINQNAGSPGATFEAWVYPTATNNYRHVISTDNGGRDWGILINNGNWQVANGSTWVNTGIAAQTGTWQHVAATFTLGSGFQFYINGALAYSYPYIYTESSTANVTLGRSPATTSALYYFAGRLDEVAVYDHPLNASEIQEHHASGIHRYHYTDAAVEPGFIYTYRIKAQKIADCPWSTATVDSIATAAPASPMPLTVATAGSTTLDLLWHDNTATETGYRIERCSGDLTICLADADFAALATLGADNTAYADTTVCNAAIYTYRVRAEKEIAGTPIWQTAWASAAGSSGAPLLPSAFTVTGISEEQIDLSWQYASADRTGFILERCSGDAAACAGGPFTQLAVIDDAGATLGYSDGGLTSGTAYTYRVHPYKSGITCPWDGPATQVSAATVTPPAPSGFSASAANTTRIDLAWTDNTTSETGYLLERCTGSDCYDFALLASLGADTVSYSDTTVCSAGTYTYRVRAEKENAGLPLWQTAWAETAAATPAPLLPTGLNATRVSEVETTLNWTDQTLDETGFRLETCEEGVTPCSLIPLGADQTVYQHIGLTPGKTYTYRLLAYKAVAGACSWETAYTPSVTLQAQVLAPGSLSQTAVNTTRIDLSWTDPNVTETGFDIERCEPGPANCIVFAAAAEATGYADATVCSGSTHTYRVRARKDTPPAWQSPWSGSVTATPGSHQIPQNLAASRVSEKEIRLNWTDGNTDEAAFVVQRCIGTTCSEFSIPASATTAASYSDSPLAADTTYIYAVKAQKDVPSGCSWQTDFSAGATATTVILPPAPFSAAPVNTTRIDLSWTDRTVAETGFRIERCEGTSCSSFSPLITVAANVSTYSDASACNGTSYTYRVAPVHASEGWPLYFSSISSAATPAPTAPLLSVASTAHDQIIVSWSDANSDETGFSIQRCAGTDCLDFIQIGTVVGSTQYSDAAVQASTAYRYRVLPVKTAPCPWPALYSNELAVLTLPAPVADLTANAVDSMTVQLHWTDAAADEEGYEVEMQLFHGQFAPIATLAPDSQSYIDRRAQPGLEHRYRIRPFRGTIYSPYSNEAAAVTPAYQEGDGGCP